MTVSLDGISVSNSYANNNGGMVYATETSNLASSITYINSAVFTGLSSEKNGGGFYIDHR